MISDNSGFVSIVIGPESDHWLPLSLIPCCLVELTDVTLAWEYANSKLFEVVIVADFEELVGNRLRF